MEFIAENIRCSVVNICFICYHFISFECIFVAIAIYKYIKYCEFEFINNMFMIHSFSFIIAKIYGNGGMTVAEYAVEWRNMCLWCLVYDQMLNNGNWRQNNTLINKTVQMCFHKICKKTCSICTGEEETNRRAGVVGLPIAAVSYK